MLHLVLKLRTHNNNFFLKRVLLIALLIVILDQVIKIYVKTTMTIGQDGLDMWLMKIHFVENNGMAFGTELNFPYGKLLLGLLRIAAITAIFIYIKKLLTRKAPVGLLIAVGCVLAGAIGNVIDGAFYGMIFSESNYFDVAQSFPPDGGYSSFMHGEVVDMFQFTIAFPDWFPFWGGKQVFPFIFNLADAAISIGVITILVGYRKYFKAPPTISEEVVHEEISSEEE